MKQRKKIRDGIGLYPPSKPNTNFSKNTPRPFLLAAVHLPAVWFLAAAWWQCLTSVFPIPADTPRLYLICFCFTAILVLLWNAPMRLPVRLLLLALLACLAGVWVWKHTDAAVNVINLTANAWLEIRRPHANPYPLRPVPEFQVTLMFAMFLLPLLLLWSLILRIRKGAVFAILFLLAPAAWILIETKVPSEMSCWLLLFSGALYVTVCGCREGRAALLKGASAACMLALLILLSALISRPLESSKESADGFYARTREWINTGWIQPLQDSYTQAKANLEERKSAHENDPESESSAPDDSQNTAEPNPSDPEQAPSDSGPDEENQPDYSVEPAPDAADVPLFPTGDGTTNPSSQDTAQNAENSENPFGQDSFGQDSSGQNGFGQNSSGNGGSPDTFPNLNALSYFQPNTGSRLILTMDSKPEETVYYPSAYGVFYENSRWTALNDGQQDTANAFGTAPPHADIPLETYLQYPEHLDRLETLCLENAPQTLAETSRFIQTEFEEHTVYDFQPGSTPSGQDFAEYFLFENQKGFCVHFATTAVLMYRICGYPARYVQGYAIPASAFHRREDGTYAAEVTGEMGHAWCEAFENEQWILKEHTLPYYGVRPVPGIPAASGSERSWKRNAAGWGLLLLKICAAAFVCLLVLLFLFFAQATLRRQRRYRRFRTVRHGAGIQRMYRAIYDTAVSQGMDKTDILSLRGFQTLRDYLTEIPADAMEWMYQTVLETMFYQKEVTKEETRRAWQIYQQFSRMFKKGLSPIEKWIYIYLKAM